MKKYRRSFADQDEDDYNGTLRGRLLQLYAVVMATKRNYQGSRYDLRLVLGARQPASSNP